MYMQSLEKRPTQNCDLFVQNSQINLGSVENSYISYVMSWLTRDQTRDLTCLINLIFAYNRTLSISTPNVFDGLRQSNSTDDLPNSWGRMIAYIARPVQSWKPSRIDTR